MTTTPHTSAIGRFAPSPTGSLHFGSVVAAVASFCMVKKLGGEWLVRIEDLDQPRVVAGATDTILRQLESLGLYWDRSIIFQSQRSERYREILDQLQKDQRLYPCDCSRKEILASAPHIGEEGPIYPGTCLHQPPQHSKPTALRLKTTAETVSFDDLIQGRYKQELAHEVGDFTLRRADGTFAYQLAAVVDDHDSEVSQVVRGRDLLSSTPRQIFLFRQLGFSIPQYAHIPLALNCNGEKISKRHHQVCFTPAVTPQALLFQALTFLGQDVPCDLKTEKTAVIVEWASRNFVLTRIPAQDHCISVTCD